MSFKVKKQHQKIRRRGSRVIFEKGNERRTCVPGAEGLLQVVRIEEPGVVTRLVRHSGLFSFFLEEREGEQPVDLVFHRDRDQAVALRYAHVDRAPWSFPIAEDDVGVSISQALMTNRAIPACLVTHEIDQQIAEFLGVDRRVCNVERLLEIHEDPRFAAVMNFAFEIGDVAPVRGSWRRAQAQTRHRITNYNAMLAAGGGVLWPETYEVVKAGVDFLVNEALVKAKVARSDASDCSVAQKTGSIVSIPNRNQPVKIDPLKGGVHE